MQKVPALKPTPRPGNDTGTADAGASAFQQELDRARRQLAKLEDKDALRSASAVFRGPPSFDESPVFVRICNLLIWAILLLPFVLAAGVLLRRLTG